MAPRTYYDRGAPPPPYTERASGSSTTTTGPDAKRQPPLARPNDDSSSSSSSSSDGSDAGSEQEETAAEEDIIISETTRWIPTPPSASIRAGLQTLRLERPVVIPRIDVAGWLQEQMPFLRAYSPALQRHGVDVAAFVAFIDNLAVAQAQPAPLKAVSMASQAVGFLPSSIAQLASAGVGAAAGLGSAAFIHVRTQRFMAVANKDFFLPRGLQVSICKDGELAEKLGLPGNQLPQLQTQPPSPISVPLIERRMLLLAPHISPLTTTDIPPLNAQQQRHVIDRITAEQVSKRRAAQQRKHDKRQHRADKRRAKTSAARAQPGPSDPPTTSSDNHHPLPLPTKKQLKLQDLQLRLTLLKTQAAAAAATQQPPIPGAKPSKRERDRADEIRKLEAKLAKKTARLDRSLQKGEGKPDKKLEKAERKEGKLLEKENKEAGKMVYLVVENRL